MAQFNAKESVPEDRQPLNRPFQQDGDGELRRFGGGMGASQMIDGSMAMASMDYDQEPIPLQTMTICAADGRELSEELEKYKRRIASGEPSAMSPKVRFRTFSDPGQNKKPREFSGRLQRTASGTLKRMRHLSTQTFAAVAPEDENPQRGTWSNQFEFFLSCLGFAVGLGNVWRFPYLCYQDGGGAFLIPFIIMLTFCGLPLLFLELTIGQYASEGPITVWKVSPMFKGLGIGMVMVSLFLACYYNVVTGWAFYYLFVSLRSVLPWSCCDPSWSSENVSCVSFSQDCAYYDNSTAAVWPLANLTAASSAAQNATNLNASMSTSKSLFAADFYFHRVALALSGGIDEIGSIQWHLAASLFAAWLLVFLVLMRGIKSFGKTVYFTSIFPYIVLFILFFRAVIEDGAVDGIIFLLTPKWEKLLEANVWGDALVQVFYSTSVCTGGIITLASYNRFHNNILRDTLILGIGNTLTSIFSSVVVFSILGFMARRQNTSIAEIVTRGPGLTFITYPQAVTLLPAAPVWSALFFVMLITLALSSMFPTVENITTAVIDQFPGTLRPYKFWITLGTCLSLYLIGLVMTTNGGMYVLQLMDKYAVGWALVIIALIEVVVLGLRYGHKRLYGDIEEMLNIKPSLFWAINWMVVCPLLLVFCIIFSLVEFSPLEYGAIVFPAWSNGIGWFLSMVSFLPVPLFALYTLYHYSRRNPDFTFLEVLREASEPTDAWGPAAIIAIKARSMIVGAQKNNVADSEAVAPKEKGHHITKGVKPPPLLKEVDEEDDVFPS